jgi:hypothetical protein
MRKDFQPRSLKQDLSIQQVGEEILIYDERRHQAFCLNRTSAAVWTHCDGTQTAAQIANALCTELAQPVTEEIVGFALAQLEEKGLVEPSNELPAEAKLAALGHLSRRSMMAKAGAGAVVMLPAIAAILAPKPADASSAGGVVSSPDPLDRNDNSLPGLRRLRKLGRK